MSADDDDDEDETEAEDEVDLAALPKLFQPDDTYGSLAWRNEDWELRTEEQRTEQVQTHAQIIAAST